MSVTVSVWGNGLSVGVLVASNLQHDSCALEIFAKHGRRGGATQTGSQPFEAAAQLLSGSPIGLNEGIDLKSYAESLQKLRCIP